MESPLGPRRQTGVGREGRLGCARRHPRVGRSDAHPYRQQWGRLLAAPGWKYRSLIHGSGLKVVLIQVVEFALE
jgi:hypothetical protein